MPALPEESPLGSALWDCLSFDALQVVEQQLQDRDEARLRNSANEKDVLPLARNRVDESAGVLESDGRDIRLDGGFLRVGAGQPLREGLLELVGVFRRVPRRRPDERVGRSALPVEGVAVAV